MVFDQKLNAPIIIHDTCMYLGNVLVEYQGCSSSSSSGCHIGHCKLSGGWGGMTINVKAVVCVANKGLSVLITRSRFTLLGKLRRRSLRLV